MYTPITAEARAAVADNAIVIEDSLLGAGMKIVGDYKCASEPGWSNPLQ